MSKTLARQNMYVIALISVLYYNVVYLAYLT